VRSYSPLWINLVAQAKDYLKEFSSAEGSSQALGLFTLGGRDVGHLNLRPFQSLLLLLGLLLSLDALEEGSELDLREGRWAVGDTLNVSSLKDSKVVLEDSLALFLVAVFFEEATEVGRLFEIFGKGKFNLLLSVLSELLPHVLSLGLLVFLPLQGERVFWVEVELVQVNH